MKRGFVQRTRHRRTTFGRRFAQRLRLARQAAQSPRSLGAPELRCPLEIGRRASLQLRDQTWICDL
jgi:hypothetical protein